MAWVPDDAAWRGWPSSPDAPIRAVTSDRIRPDATIARWFPKMRSWIALGAPLALLSPLSMARIVAVMAAATGVITAANRSNSPVGASVLVVTATLSMAWLMRCRSLTERQSTGFLWATEFVVAAVIAGSEADLRLVSYLPLFMVLSASAGLFLPTRSMMLQQTVSVVSIAAAGAIAAGVRVGIDGLTIGLACMVVAISVRVTTRAARHSSAIDPDTGLPNAHGMSVRLAEMESPTVIVATVHLEGAATARDALGHGVGTELVRRAVEDLGQVLPRSTSVGRGADHDIVVLLPSTDRDADDDVVMITRRIESAFGTGRYLLDDIEVALLPHVGITMRRQTDNPTNPTELLRCSALAAQSARDRGVSIVSWDEHTNRLTADDLAMLAELRGAMGRGELRLAYQPQVRASSRAVVAAEALLRWDSPARGSVPPATFIALAEQTGLVDRLTDWVLDETLDAQVRLRRRGIEITIAINVSPLSLRSEHFCERVEDGLMIRSLPTSALRIEVTETAAFEIPRLMERLAPLRERGVSISIDDFGTGHTSLAMLTQLPVDELKLDQQFVRGLFTIPANAAIARSVCELGHRLGLSVVAEGVESEKIASTIAAYGFDVMQGFHLAVPMSESDLVDYFDHVGGDSDETDPADDATPERQTAS